MLAHAVVWPIAWVASLGAEALAVRWRAWWFGPLPELLRWGRRR
ncbi:hypothetical protein A176_005569 [Myxococcus hansupus]|uniref:Uncharacterized protein n=1 Tax=Pseudomyxococcus hansupus TaxID=1297742 RepID=A0A0H4XK99_9BACT|nr:hypothetical protein A176_005569 [Myxococcus hansupus]